MKKDKQLDAIKLRKEGFSVGKISQLLSVSKSSVSRWVKNIELSEEHRSKLKQNIVSNGKNVGKRNIEKAREQRLRNLERQRRQYQKSGRILYRTIDDREFGIGCSLYWAEGSKDRNVVALANSDPDLLKFFVRFLRKYFDVNDSEFSLYCRYYTDLVREGEPEEYWAEILGLPKTCLRKSTVDYYVKEGKTKGKLKYGVCSVRVCSTEKVQMIYGAIKEMADINDDRWL